jgi:hypothetical protein
MTDDSQVLYGAQVRLRSWRASFSMPAFLAYCLTMCQTTFSLNPLPHAVPARVTRLKILPFEIPAACSQSSMRYFTQSGTGMVRM